MIVKESRKKEEARSPLKVKLGSPVQLTIHLFYLRCLPGDFLGTPRSLTVNICSPGKYVKRIGLSVVLFPAPNQPSLQR